MLGILYDRWQAFKKSKIRVRPISSNCHDLDKQLFLLQNMTSGKNQCCDIFQLLFLDFLCQKFLWDPFLPFFRNFNWPTFIDHFVKTLIVSKEFDRNRKNDQKSCKKMIRSIWEFPALMEKFKAGNQKNRIFFSFPVSVVAKRTNLWNDFQLER